MGAVHALLVGGLSTLLAVAVGVAFDSALLAAGALTGSELPVASTLVLVLALPAAAALTGWCVTPRKLTLVRRTD